MKLSNKYAKIAIFKINCPAAACGRAIQIHPI
jgi:hypothetical protein